MTAARGEGSPPDPGAPDPSRETPRWDVLLLVSLISVAVLGFEVSLLRILLVASWHHFAFLVISIALLGFGASGTILCLLRERLLAWGDPALHVLGVGTAIAIPLCTGLAQQVPVEARFVSVLFWAQAGNWVLYWALLAIPFFLGACTVGLALMTAGRGVGGVYAANLLGSSVGAITAPLVMMAFAPAWLPLFWCFTALLGVCALRRPRGVVRAGVAAGVCLLVGGWHLGLPPEVRVDPFKTKAAMARLEQQGTAELLARTWGPRGVLEVYAGEVFHDIPFLSVGVLPPPLSVLLVDGHHAGSLLRIEETAEAAVVENTLMAFPYGLAAPPDRVLLLGEKSGLNVWLALRSGARSVRVVERNGMLVDLLRGRLREEGGLVLEQPEVDVVVADTRHHIEQTVDRFDVIQLSSLESMAAGSGGMGGLGQDHLITVEGLTRCLELLDPQGVLFACRGIQTPPWDNVKLLATLVEALWRVGVRDVGRHVLVVRDFLGVCTVVKATPWTHAQVGDVRQRLRERHLTPVWFPGIAESELNRPDALPPAPDGRGDWYYHAARKLFSGEGPSLIEDWVYDIRPPTDDRPFFLDFCRLESIGPLRDAFGDLWLTRAEIAFLFVLATVALAATLGGLLTVLPALLLRSVRTTKGKFPTSVYFLAIGLAYLLLEMVVLSRLTLLLGDPLLAASTTLSGFLAFSGLGSAVSSRVSGRSPGVFRTIVLVLAIAAVLEILCLPRLAEVFSALPAAGRLGLAVGLVAPLGFLMGFPMPVGLARLGGGAEPLIPWAWGVNGFASVVAAPLATALAMVSGFGVAGALAVLLYLLAAWAFEHLPSGGSASSERG